jgi:gluconolactonase
MQRLYFLLFFTLVLISCKEKKSIGTIERIDPALDKIIDPDATVEIIAEGFEWSEGALWVPSENMLLFSDVPKNVIHRWKPNEGTSVYLTPSGYTGSGFYSKEPGSNGLTLSPDGKLVMCQHGDRRVAMMAASLTTPESKFITLVDQFNGKKLSSPNDAVFSKSGDLFFTDPPYGLPQQADDSTKETPFNGVYRASGGQVSLVVDSLTRPNGIALMPDEKTLIVANSDADRARWYAFDLSDSVVRGRIFYDATSLTKSEKGLPDGLRIDRQGNVFATGPGGVWIFDSEGKVLGKIKISEATSNCALADDDKTLYITADMYVLRVALRK